MKGVCVSTDSKVEVRDFGKPLYKTVGEAVGGCIEIVHPYGLRRPYVMIVNEEGLLLDLDINPIGCDLYRTMRHGQPIVGNIVIMKVGYADGEPDIVGLADNEIEEIKKLICGGIKNAK